MEISESWNPSRRSGASGTPTWTSSWMRHARLSGGPLAYRSDGSALGAAADASDSESSAMRKPSWGRAPNGPIESDRKQRGRTLGRGPATASDASNYRPLGAPGPAGLHCFPPRNSVVRRWDRWQAAPGVNAPGARGPTQECHSNRAPTLISSGCYGKLRPDVDVDARSIPRSTSTTPSTTWPPPAELVTPVGVTEIALQSAAIA